MSIMRALAKTQGLEVQDGGSASPEKKGRFAPGPVLRESLPDLVAVCADEVEAGVRQDYWLGRQDVKRLRWLLGVRGVTAIRAHLVPWRKLFAHPLRDDMSRLTLMMTPAHMGEVFCLDESPVPVQASRGRPPLWKGLTVFYHAKKKDEERQGESQVYV